MDTNQIFETIKKDIPETRNQPQLMNSLMMLLIEADKVIMRINESTSTSVNKLVIEIKIEEK